VARYDLPEGKQFTPLTFRGGRWQFKAYPAPRPLYGAELLPERPQAPVLIVEGEKCADAARAVLKAYVVVTWCGGAQAVKRNQWDALARRDVIIWPDADAPGRAAGAQLAEILSSVAAQVRIVQPPDDLPDGWDVADAIATPWDAKQVTAWATPHVKTVWPPPQTPEAPAKSEPDSAPPTAPEPIAAPEPIEGATPEVLSGDSALIAWREIGLDCNEGNVPYPTIANATLIIQAHPALKGRIWFDSFTQRIYHTLDGTQREWVDADDVNLVVWVQQSLKLSKFDMRIVQTAVGHAARRAQRNSLTDYLDALEWDGIERLNDWLQDCLGVPKDEYTMAVARNWPIGMVARAYVPGCKMDTMPVLEGAQGMRKSSFLEVLGSPWYGSIPVAFGEKDFLQAIQGHWLVEIPDMTGFSRREHGHILATLSIRHDIYRPPYGRYTVKHERVATFAATSETREYLSDLRGRRRYWPLECAAIDLDTLRAQRDQIFAEAVHRYRAGAHWYDVPAQADAVQRDRLNSDIWSERILGYVESIWAEQQRTGERLKITSTQILTNAVEVPISKQTDGEKKRLHKVMGEGGWKQVRDPERRWVKKDYWPGSGSDQSGSGSDQGKS